MSDRSHRSGPSRLPRPQYNRSIQVPQGYLAIGLIVGAHGLHGEVKVEVHTDFPERFVPGFRLFIADLMPGHGGAMQEAVVSTARVHKNHLLVNFQNLTRREQALELREHWLLVAEEEAMDLEEDAYWVHDIVGLTVYAEDERRLGTIRDVLFTGANEVYVIETEPSINRGNDLLLPAIAEVVQAVDLDEERMTVRLIPGLLEDE